MSSSFFAMISRMKYINRWGLMHNIRNENLSEHSLEVAVLAHALAVINNKRFNGSANPDRCAVLALFHDSSEILTGDLPTPIKYYNSDIQDAYKEIEAKHIKRLLEMLPDDLQDEYKGILRPEDDSCLKFVKAADKLSALIKCIEEINLGNNEFKTAKTSTEIILKKMNMPEVNVFINEFLPAYSLPLDEQK